MAQSTFSNGSVQFVVVVTDCSNDQAFDACIEKCLIFIHQGLRVVVAQIDSSDWLFGGHSLLPFCLPTRLTILKCIEFLLDDHTT